MNEINRSVLSFSSCPSVFFRLFLTNYLLIPPIDISLEDKEEEDESSVPISSPWKCFEVKPTVVADNV